MAVIREAYVTVGTVVLLEEAVADPATTPIEVTGTADDIVVVVDILNLNETRETRDSQSLTIHPLRVTKLKCILCSSI